MNRHAAEQAPPLSVIDESISHPKSPKSDRNNLEHASLGALGSPKPKLFAPSPKSTKVADPSKLESRKAREYEKLDPDGVDDGDDVGSNVQEGQRSELGEMILPVVSTSRHNYQIKIFTSLSENPVRRTHLVLVTNRSIQAPPLATLVLSLQTNMHCYRYSACSHNHVYVIPN
jgi:hypothetical protein